MNKDSVTNRFCRAEIYAPHTYIAGYIDRVIENALALFIDWKSFETLFGSGQERVDLLNATATNFAGRLFHIMYDHALLGICRATDGDKVAGKDNVSLRGLQKRLSHTNLLSSPDLEKLENLVDDAVVAASFARDWRNRKIAHHDLDLAMKDNAKPLASATRAKVTHVIEKIFKPIVFIRSKVEDVHFAWEMTVVDDGALGLLINLYVGQESDRDWRADFRQRASKADPRQPFPELYPKWLSRDYSLTAKS